MDFMILSFVQGINLSLIHISSELISEASKKENPVILVDQEMYSSIRQYDPTVIEAVNNTEMARYMFTDTEELPVDGQYDDHSTAVSLFVKGVEFDASIMNEIFAEDVYKRQEQKGTAVSGLVPFPAQVFWTRNGNRAFHHPVCPHYPCLLYTSRCV